jgi:hypothetical protein
MNFAFQLDHAAVRRYPPGNAVPDQLVARYPDADFLNPASIH